MEKLLDNPGGCKGRLEGKIVILELEGLSSAYRFHDTIFKIPQDRNEDERNSKNTNAAAVPCMRLSSGRKWRRRGREIN